MTNIAGTIHANRDPRTPTTPSYPGQGSNPGQGSFPAKRKFVAKGHDAQLQEAQLGQIPVELTMMSGISHFGIITKRDKFTITLTHSDGGDPDRTGCPEIFYKHAIEGVLLKTKES
jgi:Uncharacterized host factor I protein